MEQIRLTRPATTLIRPVAYWVTTGLIVLETAVGAEWDLARITFVKDIFTHLGYPLYLLTILGVWKLPAAIVLVIPRFGRLKEWAYFGLLLVYTGAAASHFMHGDIAEVWGPVIFALLTVASRALRPDSRKWIPGLQQTDRASTFARVGYWITTILVAFPIFSGGLFQLISAKESVDGIMHLGYPAFFVLILGFWKVLGGVAILVPRFPRIKEWAYAGIVFDLTGAAASNAMSGMPGWHVAAPLVICAFALLSWYLRASVRPATA
ncbi:MAG TPA: DoxX family protein [Puia sp.]|nr:DoxX family protein [Puia sp.]